MTARKAGYLLDTERQDLAKASQQYPDKSIIFLNRILAPDGKMMGFVPNTSVNGTAYFYYGKNYAPTFLKVVMHGSQTQTG